MGKMSEIAFLLETGDEKGLVEFFGNYGWRKSVSEIGGKEFLKAFDEINKDKDKKKKNKKPKLYTLEEILKVFKGE